MTMGTGDPAPDGGGDGDEDEDYDGFRPWWSRRKWLLIAVAILVVIGLGLGLGLGLTGSSDSPAGPEGVPLESGPVLASPDTTVSGTPVDGLTCRRAMADTDPYHVHVHVAIFVDGRQERIPAGVGIVPPRASVQLPGGTFVQAGSSDCLYWLHTHADDGIIHVEAPAKRNFTLGEFFDVWGQPLGPDQVGPARGTVVAFENGKRFQGNPRDIPLDSQAVIQLDVGHPVVSFKPMTFKVIGICSTSCSALPGS